MKFFHDRGTHSMHDQWTKVYDIVCLNVDGQLAIRMAKAGEV